VERLREFVPGGCKGRRDPRSDGPGFLMLTLAGAQADAGATSPNGLAPTKVKRCHYRWIEQGVIDRMFAAVSR